MSSLSLSGFHFRPGNFGREGGGRNFSGKKEREGGSELRGLLLLPPFYFFNALVADDDNPLGRRKKKREKSNLKKTEGDFSPSSPLSASPFALLRH